MIDFKNITEKYKSLRLKIETYPNRKFYHLNSIENYILHYNDFGVEFHKTKVVELLDEYIEFVNSKTFVSETDGNFIFQNYVKPIGIIYANTQGFSYYFKPFTILMFVIPLLITLYIIKTSITFPLILTAVSIIILIRGYQKKNINKVYGYFF
jgi:hypothetical protein